MTDPLLDDECAVDVAADFLNPAKTDHKKVMVSDRLVRHICDVLSSGLFNKVAPKLTYKTVDALQVVSWASLWMHMFPERNRKQWVKYIKSLGIPEAAIVVTGTPGKAAAASLVLGGLIYAGKLPTHRLVNVQPKVPGAVHTIAWPATAA